MKVFILIEDETNYCGGIQYMGVFTDGEKADAVRREKLLEQASKPFPADYYIEESTLITE